MTVPIRYLFIASLLLTIICMASLSVLDAPLRNAISPCGIVSLELCAYSDSCKAIIHSWKPSVQLMAALGLGVDYLFLCAYSTAIFLGLLLLAKQAPSFARRAMVMAALFTWIAALADAVENYCLSQMLLGGDVDAFGRLGTFSASLKFIIISVNLVILFVALVFFVCTPWTLRFWARIRHKMTF
jgi:hypothetical protein